MPIVFLEQILLADSPTRDLPAGIAGGIDQGVAYSFAHPKGITRPLDCPQDSPGEDRGAQTISSIWKSVDVREMCGNGVQNQPKPAKNSEPKSNVFYAVVACFCMVLHPSFGS